MKRAMVQITGFSARSDVGNRRVPVSDSTFTDPAGAFQFKGLPAAEYSLQVQKPEFTPLMKNQTLTASVDSVRLPIAPLGVITGKITDEDGNPVRLVNVLALQVEIQDGQRQTKRDRTVTTNDLGIFRLWNLMPGKYFIKAAGQGGGTYSYSGDTAPRLSLGPTFAPVYFGGGDTVETASAVDIEPGSEATADIKLRSRPAYKIRGQVTNFISHRTMQFELLKSEEDVAPSRVSVNAESGRFEIQDVVAGSYLLRAVQDKTRGEIPVQVTDSDVSGLSIPLFAGVDIEVRTHLADTPPEPKTDTPMISRGRLFGGCVAALRPVQGRSSTIYRASPDSKQPRLDLLLLAGVLPGRYRVSAECFAVYPMSVRSGSQDLLTNPIVSIEAGAQPPPIDILASYAGGRISGKLKSAVAFTSLQGIVLLVPVAGGEPRTASLIRQQKEGSQEALFQFDSLAPGAYRAWAFADSKTVEFRNPAWISALSGGTDVQIDAKAQTAVTIAEFSK